MMFKKLIRSRRRRGKGGERFDPFISGSKSSYYSYELNLVLHDGSRINVVDQGNLKRLRSDANTLSQFLESPSGTRRRAEAPGC